MIEKNDNIVTGMIIILSVSERSVFNRLKETDGLENRKVAEILVEIYDKVK